MTETPDKPSTMTHSSFFVLRPGLLPGHRIKPHLALLDVIHSVLLACSLTVWFLVWFVVATTYLARRQPNGGLPLIKDLAIVIFGFLVTYLPLPALMRAVIKWRASLSSRFTKAELSYFPLDTDGRLWTWPYKTGLLKPLPVEWQEPVLDSESSQAES